MDNRVLIDADCKYAYSVVGGHSIFGKELLENEHYTKTVLVVLSWNEHPSKRHISMYSMSNKIGSFDVDWYWYNTTDYTVTHWMPMPKLPNE